MFAPVVIFAFQRPEHLEKLVKSLLLNKEASQTDLILFCDGKKSESQMVNIEKIKDFSNRISGFKSVKNVFRPENFGLAKNIIRTLLSSIIVFLLGAIFFYLLGSEYNAIVQAAVYGLAIPVIVGLTIMFTTGNKEKEHSSLMPYIILITSLIFVFVVMSGTAINPDIFNTVDSLHLNSYENITAFGKGIYIKYVWGFEVLSLLLTVVIAGFTIFKNEKRQIGNER